jgi:Protein of unknown function (DUF2971)
MLKHPHVPAKLYKYRRFSSTHLDALIKNVLWMSSPNKFSDTCDAAVYVNTDRFLIEDRSSEESDARHKDELTKLTEDIFRKEADENVKLMSDWFRSGFSVLSLSENYSSVLMWSFYSESHKGFVIEYDFSRLDYSDPRRRLCYPIFYTRKPRDATRYMARTNRSDYNILFGQFMCLIKQCDYFFEKEWRIVHALGAPYANREISMPEPTAIFLGAEVAPDDEEKMRDQCRTRTIPLKRMVQRPGTFELGIIDVPL